ncbi:MAG: hypothetical protein JSV19_04520 [Phycisphaerales bacterium]|nr:MAG: hypothetical protein JSV19_04520 [Phycisphaerales bacterium]
MVMAGSARADIVPTEFVRASLDLAGPSTAADSAESRQRCETSPRSDCYRQTTVDLASGIRSALNPPLPRVEDSGGKAGAEAGEPVVREMPPLPGSVRLVLSGFLTLGAWHLVRSARHPHWQTVPEWYHTAAPAQIGHAVCFDVALSTMPLCCFESAARGGGDERPFLYRVRREVESRHRLRSFLAVESPRGPPALAV